MIIKKTEQYELKAEISRNGKYFSLSLHQHFPKANHPFWSRLCQLNFEEDELRLLANVINAAVTQQEVAPC